MTPFGEIVEAKVVTDRDTGRPVHVGFIDDRWGIGAIGKLIGQVAAAGILFASGGFAVGGISMGGASVGIISFGGFGFGGGPGGWLGRSLVALASNETVQTELKLSDKQKAQVKSLSEKIDAQRLRAPALTFNAV